MGLSPESHYRTDDMALVSCLRYFGHSPQSIDWEERKCYWYFLRSKTVEDTIEKFLDRSLLVEPKQFNFLFGETKKDFYKLYDRHRGN